MIITIASACGVDPSRFSRAIWNIPGFEPRRITVDGRQLRARPAPTQVAEALGGNWDALDVGLYGASPNDWAFVLATRRVGPNLNRFDTITVNWQHPPMSSLEEAFVDLCEASNAEFALLDEVDPAPGFAWTIDLHRGIPALGWMTFVGPQLAQLQPCLFAGNWWKRRPLSRGTLLMLSANPADAAEAAEKARRLIGDEVFFPRAAPLRFDLSSKNTVMPAWLNVASPPHLSMPAGAGKKRSE